MDVRGLFTKERIIGGLQGLGRLRVRASHDSLIIFSALALILFIAFSIRLFPLRWELQGSTIHITEFDGYFQYRFTKYVVDNGFLSWVLPTDWVDTQRWFPGGIDVAQAGYPGLPMIGAFLYQMVSSLGVRIDLMSFCALLAPIFGTLACFVVYFLGKDIGGKPAGLFSALFLALSPSFIQRSSVGWYDDEIIGIPFILLFMLMFLRSIDDGRSTKSSVVYALGGGLLLGIVIAGWGAAYFAVGVLALYVFLLIVIGRYTQHLFLSYSLTFGLSLFIAISVPKLSPSYLTSFAVLPVAGIFLLLCVSEILKAIKTARAKIFLTSAFLALIVGGLAVVWQFGYMRGIAGKFISVIDPFLRSNSPIIESVAEHRISAWGSIYYEFGIGILFFVAGLYFVLRRPNNRNLFILIFGLTSLYFASSMVRLLVLMAPAFGLLGAVGIVGVLKPFVALLKEAPKIAVKRKFSMEHVGREYSGAAVFFIFLILMSNFAFPMPKVYKQAYAPTTISAGSLPILPNAQVNEWLDMLQWTQNNLKAGTVVSSWWDYGYWLTVLGNVTTLADNATINTTQIENIGFSFMANETQSVKMLRQYNTEYVLVFATFGYSSSSYSASWLDGAGGDNGKWTWMAQISGKARQRFIDAGMIDEADAWTDQTTFGNYTSNTWKWNTAGINTVIYKLMGYGKSQWCEENQATDPDASNVTKPRYFDEAFFSGLTLSGTDATSRYGGIVPLVCLYKINYALYDADQSARASQ